jgi:hypothetical protein
MAKGLSRKDVADLHSIYRPCHRGRTKLGEMADKTLKRMTIERAKDRLEMAVKGTKGFLKAMDAVVEESFDTDRPLTRISERQHMICHGRELMICVNEDSGLIELKMPYCVLPESIKRLVDYGRKVGYRIRRYS